MNAKQFAAYVRREHRKTGQPVTMDCTPDEVPAAVESVNHLLNPKTHPAEKVPVSKRTSKQWRSLFRDQWSVTRGKNIERPEFVSLVFTPPGMDPPRYIDPPSRALEAYRREVRERFVDKPHTQRGEQVLQGATNAGEAKRGKFKVMPADIRNKVSEIMNRNQMSRTEARRRAGRALGVNLRTVVTHDRPPAK
ncbi:MAG TPA: hypothetical protein PKE12_05765 [Kiritimatiellia bacterium]|nr:hypothetical protein [Kiritimatiellia bacterium]